MKKNAFKFVPLALSSSKGLRAALLINFSLLLVAQNLIAFAPSTGMRSYDQALRSHVIDDKKFHVRVSSEVLTAARAYDIDSHKSNLISIYEKDQATIESLLRPVPGSAAAAGAQAELGRMRFPADDGVRGHIKLAGNYNEISIMPNVGARVELKGLPGSFGLDLHVPVVRKSVTVLSLTDQTRVEGDPLFQPLFDPFVSARVAQWPATMQTLGGLSTENVSATGLGDAAVMLSWRNYFVQDKELIKGVELYAQLGLSMPTGKERDEDKAFSMALGSDGAFGIPVGLGLNVDFVNTIRAGLNVDFLAYLDKTRDRRLKTIAPQSELFLLNKGRALRDHGLNWQFYMYLQSYHFISGLSAKAAYQYLRHDTDKFSPRDSNFSYDVINTAKRLTEWYAHNIILSLDYDHLGSDDHLVVPQLSLFYKFPVGGKAVVAMQSVGVSMGVNF